MQKTKMTSADELQNNSEKKKMLLDIWYSETFNKEYIGKLNLDRNEVLEDSKQGTFPNYLENVQQKASPKISATEIVLEEDEPSLQMVFWYNTGCLDTSNFQNGILDGSYLNDLKNSIQKFNPEDGRIVVMMTGNLVGKEWELKHLKDAFVVEDENGDMRRLFYGLRKRKIRITNDIKSALKFGAKEVYLMKGAEEFEVLKKTGCDVLQEIVDDLKDDRVKYIEEGTETKLNFIKKNKDGKNYYNIIKLQNLKPSSSQNPSVMEVPNKILSESRSDVSFINGGNFTAARNHENEFFPSGQLMYLNTPRGKNPKAMVNDGNVFRVMPEANHSVTVVKGGQNLFEHNLPLINKIYRERRKSQLLGKILQEKIQEQSDYLIQKDIKIVKGRDM